MSCTEYCDLDAPDCVPIEKWDNAMAVLMNEVRCDMDNYDACGQVGVWEWGDPDGVEVLCDGHKNDNFHFNGPILLENRVKARELLRE